MLNIQDNREKRFQFVFQQKEQKRNFLEKTAPENLNIIKPSNF